MIRATLQLPFHAFAFDLSIDPAFDLAFDLSIDPAFDLAFDLSIEERIPIVDGLDRCDRGRREG